MRGAGVGMTIGAAMRLKPRSSSSGEGGSMGGKDDNDGGGNGAENDDGDSPSVDVKRTLSATILSADRLALLIKNSASLRLAMRASINISEDVVWRHADLLRHSGELSAAAERLQAEEALLTRRAEEIGMPLEAIRDRRRRRLGMAGGSTWERRGRRKSQRQREQRSSVGLCPVIKLGKLCIEVVPKSLSEPLSMFGGRRRMMLPIDGAHRGCRTHQFFCLRIRHCNFKYRPFYLLLFVFEI